MSDKSTPAGVRAVIFDISGTVLDFGSRAPVAAFVELFARHGVAVTAAEVRAPMGLHKIDHIWSLLSEPGITARWVAKNGAQPSRQTLDQLYAEFAPIQMEAIPRHCDVIPGVLDVVRELRARGIAIANTTGYDKRMLTDLIPLAAKAGYSPDLWVTPDDVGQGRPAPWMAFHAARQLGVYPMSAFVKVGDTPADLAEGHAAGMWTVSVVQCGNEVGLSERDLGNLPAAQRAAALTAARARLDQGRPHYMIDTTADLIPVIDEISDRIGRGEKP